jgi:hypothetical protein
MAYYKIYQIDDQGQIFRPPIELDCRGDELAIAEASKYLDRCGVEVWEGSRYVATFSRQKEAAAQSGLLEPTDADLSFGDRYASLSAHGECAQKEKYRR